MPSEHQREEHKFSLNGKNAQGLVQAETIEKVEMRFASPLTPEPPLPAQPQLPQAPTDRNVLPPVCATLLPMMIRHRMPYHSLGHGFVGKVRDIWAIHDALIRDKTAVVEGAPGSSVGVVTGMGGIGKTQLAIEYVHRFGMCYPGGIFWTDADQGLSTVISQVLGGAGDIEPDPTLREKDQLIQLWARLCCDGTVLVVFDNFPETIPLRDWLPPTGAIHTLVTTRRRDLSTYASVPLETLLPDEGLRLINSGDRQFGEEARALTQALGGLPLALELARHFLNLRHDLTPQDLLDEITSTGEIRTLEIFTEAYGDQLPSGHIREVAGTIKMSWDLASEAGKAVLQAMSLLAPVPVPRRLLRKILDMPCQSRLTDPLGIAITELDRNLSLADLDAEGDPFIHRLIAGFARTTIELPDDLHEKVLEAIKTEMARVTDDHDRLAYYELEKIVPHADALIYSEWITEEQISDISNYLGWYCGDQGRYRLAETYRRQALESAQKSFEPGHPSVAIRQSNLALVLKALGELSEARDLLRQALESDKKSFEPGHPSVARSQSNLALVLKDLGELSEARDLLRQAYEVLLDKYGPDFPLTKIAKGNLDSVG